MEDRLATITRFYFEHYIARLNIEYYKKLLETEIDEPKRRIVTRLLAEAIEPAPGVMILDARDSLPLPEHAPECPRLDCRRSDRTP
jgi:hypothetical protein